VTWLIIEPQFDGHHYVYLEHIVAGAFDRGIDVIVGVGDDASGKNTIAALARRFGARKPQTIIGGTPKACNLHSAALSLACTEFRRRRFFREVFQKAKGASDIELVFLPYFDKALFAIGLLGSPFGTTPFAGITMGQRFHFDALGITGTRDKLAPIKRRLFQRLLRHRALSRIFTIDETLAEYFNTGPKRISRKVVFFPDPSDAFTHLSRNEARSRLNLDPNACVVLAYGFLDERKALDRLVAWLSSVAVSNSTLLLAVGNQSPEVESIFAGAAATNLLANGRLQITKRFVSDDEEAIFFRAADVVWLGYDSFDLMSGVLVRAAQHRLAIVHEDRGLIGRYAKKYGHRVPVSHRCGALYGTIPPGLMVTTFDGGETPTPVPDHSWSRALNLIFD
jgi:hypothetical protein